MARPISELTRAELVDEVVRLQQRNADLAAHVERLRIAWRQYEDSEYCSEDEIKAEEQLYALMEEDPATSLARLKAQWQAEALDALAEKLRWGHVVDAIKEEAADLRRQAEGGEV